MSETWKRRDRFEIIMRILGLAKEGIHKTKLMFKANLQYKSLQRYLKLLEARGLLKRHRSQNSPLIIFQTTSKGLQVLNHYSAIKDLLTSKTTQNNSEE